MSIKHYSIIACSAALMIGACTPKPQTKDGQYWQRANASESIWLQGPKAQQSLNRDIARCITELRELERLGSLRNAIPTEKDGSFKNPDDHKLTEWDTPEHDRHLLAEHSDYHDFEGCMLTKGWERVEYLPFDRAHKSRDNYLKSHVDYEYQTRIGGKNYKGQPVEKKPRGNFDNLNE